jgi:hypothetical protein
MIGGRKEKKPRAMLKKGASVGGKIPGREVGDVREHTGDVVNLERFKARKAVKAGLGFLFKNLFDLSQEV